jgi:hypothetical protein
MGSNAYFSIKQQNMTQIDAILENMHDDRPAKSIIHVFLAASQTNQRTF